MELKPPGNSFLSAIFLGNRTNHSFSIMKKITLLLLLHFIAISLFAQQDNNAIALRLTSLNKEKAGLKDEDIKNSIVSNSYYDNAGKIQLVYLQQSYLGLPVYNQIQVMAFKGDILVSNTGGRISSIEKKSGGLQAVPKITAAEALVTALADKGIRLTLDPLVVGSEKNGHYLVFDNMGIMHENITAELMWVPVQDGKQVFLAWQVYLAPTGSSDYWMIRIDANTNQDRKSTRLNSSHSSVSRMPSSA